MKPLTKIDKQNIEDILALTPMQEGMLFHYLRDPQNQHYFEQLSLGLSGEIDIQVFKKAWNLVIETNDMLRVVFRWEEIEKPVQIILKEHKLQLEYYDISTRDASEKKQQLAEITVKDRKKKFDLRKVPFRVTLCKSAKDKYQMIISNHHILYDGWSNGIILKEFFSAYNDLSIGNKWKKPIKPKFKEFIKRYRKQDIDREKKTWTNYLKGFDVKTELPVDEKRGNIVNIPFTSREKFPMGMKGKLNAFVAAHKITLASLFYGAWGILLQKYNNSEDVVFGTPISGRSVRLEGIENMVGLFINTLPLRVQTFPGEQIVEFLYRITGMLKDREPYGTTSLVNIKEYSEVDKKEELFDSLLVLENYPLDVKLLQKEGGLSIGSYSIFGAYHFALVVNILAFDDMVVNFKYNKVLFKQGTIEKIAEYFIKILSFIIENPGKKVRDIELIPAEKKLEILSIFNEELFSPVDVVPFQDILFDGFPKFASKVALDYGEKQITYSQLEKPVTGVANWIINSGIKPQTFIGVVNNDKAELILTVLGIVKAGCVFVPLDSSYPKNRLEMMIKHAGLKVIISDRDNISSFSNSDVIKRQNTEFVLLDKILVNDCQLGFYINPPVPIEYQPDDKLYILFTSGTSGRPKAIIGSNKGIHHFVKWEIETFAVDHHFRFSQLSSPSFDPFLRDVFVPLSVGGVVCIPGSNQILIDGEQLIHWINKKQIRLIHVVPSLFRLFNGDTLTGDHFKSLKYVLLAGESVNPAELKKWYNKFAERIQLVNCCGPTETTQSKIVYFIKKSDVEKKRVPIGRALDGARAIILDKDMNVCPPGMTGEICIRTPYRSIGYCNEPALTHEKFIPNPFNINHRPIDIIYRTGDLGRISGSGHFEILGRTDHQVKIRGFRIEPGEVENCLLRHAEIKEAVVIAVNGENHDNFLCAYFVTGKELKISQLREYLSGNLPGYMIPAYFVRLERIPLTLNGKVDRKKLPKPQMKAGEEYIAPQDDWERKQVEIWAKVLEIDKNVIGMDSNFFELGGHSLKVTMLVSQIHKELHVNIPLNEVFEKPTIRELSAYIKKMKKDKYLSIEPVEKKDYYSVSSAQKRLVILQEMDASNTAYNMVQVIEIEEEPDGTKLDEAFRELIHRHESLRTSFHMIDGEPVQKIQNEITFKIEYYDMKEVEVEVKVEEERSLLLEGTRGLAPLFIEHATRNPQPATALISSFIRPFDLSRAPLLRVGVTALPHTPTALRYLLVIDMHHIISDGVSLEILAQEFVELYRGKHLPDLKLQYKDYSQWQNRLLTSGAAKSREEYWLKQFEREVPVLNLPLDYQRTAVQTFDGDTLAVGKIGNRDTGRLKKMAAEKGATLNMVLLAVFNILLLKYTNREDIVVGIPTAGRNHDDLNHIIGMFVNMLAMRNHPSYKKRFVDFLEEVKTCAVNAYENQDFQFDTLIEKLKLKRNTNRNPLFDVVFAFQSIEERTKQVSALETRGFRIKPHRSEFNKAKFDLILGAVETRDGIHFEFTYCSKLFKTETIKTMGRYLINTINGVIKNPGARISEIEIVSVGEELHLLKKIRQEKNIPRVKNRGPDGDTGKNKEVKFNF